MAVAASGGKDSTVLAHVLKTLNERYDYGLDLTLLSIDEGITGNYNQPKWRGIFETVFRLRLPRRQFGNC